jgi:DeoR family fructose operon transcriptional repressor
MTYELRKRAILSELEQSLLVDVLAIAGSLEVSPITIRRDLDKLAKDGLLKRTHGGAAKLQNQALISFDQKSINNAEQKKYICKLAAELIEDGDSIFIDCGSTTFGLSEFIKDKKIKVITNSLPVFNALIGSDIDLNLIGGAYDKKRMAVHGEMAIQHIQKYYADKSFIGADAISVVHGLSANSEAESSITKAMITNSHKTILLCDASKIDKRTFYTFAEITDIDILISNVEAKSKLNSYERVGIHVMFQ